MKEENKVMIQNELYLKNKEKGVLDSIQEKVASRVTCFSDSDRSYALGRTRS